MKRFIEGEDRQQGAQRHGSSTGARCRAGAPVVALLATTATRTMRRLGNTPWPP